MTSQSLVLPITMPTSGLLTARSLFRIHILAHRRDSRLRLCPAAVKIFSPYERCRRRGSGAIFTPAEEFRAYFKAELAKWSKVVQASGARVE